MLAILLWGTGTALAESRLALVIGNSSYETVTVLPNPANDAKAMTEFLKGAGFDVVAAPNLAQNEMRQAISNFAGMVAAKGPDTVALVFYAGHGLQVDGENFLVPIDARIQREADVPMQAMRLADLMNILRAVPTKATIAILDACRNNPFSEINKTTGRGLAIVDAPTGSFVSYSTAPGTEAQDGDGENSPFTTALLAIGREPGLPIEQAFKRVRSMVHNSTRQTQTPWESSSLTTDFAFFPGAGGGALASADKTTKVSATSNGGASGRRVASRSVESWRSEFKSRPAPDAYRIVIEEGTPEAFEAYLAVYNAAPNAPRVRSLLDRRREMMAWYTAVTLNTIASYEAFLGRYGGSDLALTAQRLLQRARDRSLMTASIGPTCPCSAPNPPPREKKAEDKPKKKKTASREEEKPKKTSKRKRGKDFISDEQMASGGRPAGGGGGGVSSAPPISIGIGIPIGGRIGGGGGRGVPMGQGGGMGGHRY
jgi:hypothetical protein